MFYFKTALFLLIAGSLVWLSRASLFNPQAHGFYRFFAWLAILILAFMNVDYWFLEPLSFHQILSWLLLFSSLYLVLDGVLRLKATQRSDAERDDAALLGFEKTTKLVTDGIYRYIRHPMYCSLLLLAWGVFFKRTTLLGFIFALSATFFLILTAKFEEQENIRFFGSVYTRYMQTTKMFFPHIL